MPVPLLQIFWCPSLLGVILAAGKGRRLRPLTETRPKALLPFLGKPLIYLHLDLLRKIGIKRVVVVVSYLGEQVVEKVRQLVNEVGIDVEFVSQSEELGTAHALKAAIKHYEDDMVVVYGDLYIDIGMLYQALKEAIDRRDCYIVGVRVDDVSRYGKLIIDGDRVLGIIEKPSKGGRGIVNAGIYILKHNVVRLIDSIGLSPRGEYELTDLVSIASEKGYNFRVIEIDNSYWQDIGYPWDLLRAVKLELSKYNEKVVKGYVEHLATLKGPVIVEEGACIKGSTYIEGPAYIGREASIGPSSYIRPYTVIEEKSHIGFAVEVKESIVLEDAHAHHLTYVGDSIIGEHVNLGAGTTIANLRLDNRTVKMTIDGIRIDTGRRKMGAVIGGYVKTGINVSIMPGVKIGSHSTIYPGIVVYKDVPPNTIVDKDWR